MVNSLGKVHPSTASTLVRMAKVGTRWCEAASGGSRSRHVAAVTADVHFDDAALAFDGDDALFEGFEEGTGVGYADDVEARGGVVVGDDGDVADAHDAVEEGLLETDVFNVPEFER